MLRPDPNNKRWYEIFQHECVPTDTNNGGDGRIAGWHTVYLMLGEATNGPLNYGSGIECVVEALSQVIAKAKEYDKIVAAGPEAFYDKGTNEPALQWVYKGYRPRENDAVLYEVRNPNLPPTDRGAHDTEEEDFNV